MDDKNLSTEVLNDFLIIDLVLEKLGILLFVERLYAEISASILPLKEQKLIISAMETLILDIWFSVNVRSSSMKLKNTKTYDMMLVLF